MSNIKVTHRASGPTRSRRWLRNWWQTEKARKGFLGNIFRRAVKKWKRSCSSSAARTKSGALSPHVRSLLPDWPLQSLLLAQSNYLLPPSLPSFLSAEPRSWLPVSDVLPGKATLARLIPCDKHPPLRSFLCLQFSASIQSHVSSLSDLICSVCLCF